MVEYLMFSRSDSGLLRTLRATQIVLLSIISITISRTCFAINDMSATETGTVKYNWRFDFGWRYPFPIPFNISEYTYSIGRRLIGNGGLSLEGSMNVADDSLGAYYDVNSILLKGWLENTRSIDRNVFGWALGVGYVWGDVNYKVGDEWVMFAEGNGCVLSIASYSLIPIKRGQTNNRWLNWLPDFNISTEIGFKLVYLPLKYVSGIDGNKEGSLFKDSNGSTDPWRFSGIAAKWGLLWYF